MGNFFNNGPKFLKLIVRVRIYHILIYIWKKSCWFENWIFKNFFSVGFIEIKRTIYKRYQWRRKVLTVTVIDSLILYGFFFKFISRYPLHNHVTLKHCLETATSNWHEHCIHKMFDNCKKQIKSSPYYTSPFYNFKINYAWFIIKTRMET